MSIDLTNFNNLGSSISEFLQKDTQFNEDTTTILSKLSAIDTELMEPYSTGSTTDRGFLDKMLETLQNWRESLDKILETAPLKILKSSFSFTEGEDNSIDQPYLSYDNITNTLSLNVSSYSNDIVINEIPFMQWENGNQVLLSMNWYGIGTKRASCVIDSSGHADEKVQGSVKYVRSNVIEPVKVVTKFLLSTSDYSVDKPYISFDQLTNKLTLNMNVFKDTPHVNQIPVLKWLGDTTSETETVDLQTDWVGLGTYGVNCIIDVPDSAGPITEMIEGTIILTYEPGSSEAWSLRYNWDNYMALTSVINNALKQNLPQNTSDYVSYVESINVALSDLISLESELEKDYAIASSSDLPIINHTLSIIDHWRTVLYNTLTNINAMYSYIRIS